MTLPALIGALVVWLLVAAVAYRAGRHAQNVVLLRVMINSGVVDRLSEIDHATFIDACDPDLPLVWFPFSSAIRK